MAKPSEEVTNIGLALSILDPLAWEGQTAQHGDDVCGGGLCRSLTEIWYYSCCTNPTEQDFFVPARTLIAVKLLRSVSCCLCSPIFFQSAMNIMSKSMSHPNIAAPGEAFSTVWKVEQTQCCI